MRKIFIITSLALCAFTSRAQFEHYFSLNNVFYCNYFNAQKDKIAPLHFFAYYPNLSYKLKKNKIGFELFYSDNAIAYYHGTTFSPEYMPDGGIQQILSYTLGVAFHYTILDKKYLKINPMIGAVFCNYDPTVIDGWLSTAAGGGGWNEPYFRDEFERRYGLLTGVNINVPIWRGIYANTNARYAFYPTAQFNKQNLILDFGVGYMLQNKKVKKK